MMEVSEDVDSLLLVLASNNDPVNGRDNDGGSDCEKALANGLVFGLMDSAITTVSNSLRQEYNPTRIAK